MLEATHVPRRDIALFKMVLIVLMVVMVVMQRQKNLVCG